jgi:hypothetical protein
VKRRELMISVMSISTHEEYRGCDRRASVMRARSSALAPALTMGGGGVTGPCRNTGAGLAQGIVGQGLLQGMPNSSWQDWPGVLAFCQTLYTAT